ncbi:inorganic triphosphatase [Leclercia adecarboxylata]|uniref:CYTH domain-containing protein n=1 Tax=Leclercia adecarboxylata TaxID=83655 RepID=UPI002DB7C74F|nr:inorganic triphosphatase [Leclercia adecarboxylata]MEB6380883.1 inorganic triphosphatase [Leclercia adecarboxylata]
MAQEIELKFIIENDSVEALRNHLHQLTGEHHEPVQLLNIYYETQDLWLRRHDMGLRIRGVDGRYEMTMKIAGRVVGGLHQRPEYNIEIDQPALDLSRFPTEVWPEGQLPEGLAESVNPLFSTDFWREKWLVNEGKSRIEIALDRGEVKAGEFQEPICELELELLEGHADDVLKLARKLVTQSGLRQGSLSKAARGYHLAQGNAPRTLKPLEIMRVAPKSSIEQGFEASLELALSQWQHHEELWVRGVKGAKAGVLEAIALVRHSLTLFGGIVPRKASTHLRDLLTQTETLMASDVSAETVVYSPQTATAKLALTEFLVTRGWRTFLDAKAQAKIAENFKRFADIHLSRHAAELRTTFAHPLGDQYGDQLIRLARNIDSILLLAGAYDGPLARAWLENWQGLLHAIKTRQHIEIEHFRNEAISQEPFWLHSGKR